MSIKPKQLIGEERQPDYSDAQYFTDRCKPQQKFRELIEQMGTENKNGNYQYHVLNYYGIGGIGKSSLLRKISRTIPEEYSDVIYSSVDLADVSIQTPGRLLLELTKSFSSSELKFYHFSLAYSIYFQKCNKDIMYKQNNHLIFNEELGIVMDFLALIDGLGILGVIPGTVNKIYDASYKRFHLDKEIKNDLKRLELLSIVEIEKVLPAFFAYDLKKYIMRDKHSRFVILIDTFEALWLQGRNDITKFSQDAFFRELISHLPGVLFIINSREHIDWDVLDEDWNNIIEPVILDKFSEEDANEFLLKCNIQEEAIRKRMYELSMGHPYQLNLLVDTYTEMNNSGITPQCELFATNSHLILECFFKYLQTEEIAVIKLLSVPRIYNYMLFKDLLSNFPTGYPITMFKDFNKFSFVSSLGNNYYHIHEIMREDLNRIIPLELLTDIHKQISCYYKKLLDMDQISYENEKLYTKECIYHLSGYLCAQDYLLFIKSNFLTFFKKLQLKGESAYLYNILENIYTYITYDSDVELFEIYTDMIMLYGHFRNAVQKLDVFLKQYSLRDISQNRAIMHLYIKKIKHQMVYAPLQETVQSVEMFLPLVDYDANPYQFLECQYTKGNMLLEQGDFGESEALFIDILQKAETCKLEDIQCRTLRKLADCYLAKKDIYNADLYCTRGMQIATNLHYDRYYNYLL